MSRIVTPKLHSINGLNQLTDGYIYPTHPKTINLLNLHATLVALKKHVVTERFHELFEVCGDVCGEWGGCDWRGRGWRCRRRIISFSGALGRRLGWLKTRKVRVRVRGIGEALGGEIITVGRPWRG